MGGESNEDRIYRILLWLQELRKKVTSWLMCKKKRENNRKKQGKKEIFLLLRVWWEKWGDRKRKKKNIFICLLGIKY